MKTAKKAKTDLRPNYDFSSGTRGKYAARFAKGSNIVMLEPDIAKFFPDSESVNEALRVIVRVAAHRAGR